MFCCTFDPSSKLSTHLNWMGDRSVNGSKNVWFLWFQNKTCPHQTGKEIGYHCPLKYTQQMWGTDCTCYSEEQIKKLSAKECTCYLVTIDVQALTWDGANKLLECMYLWIGFWREKILWWQILGKVRYLTICSITFTFFTWIRAIYTMLAISFDL